jgi:hypothetical protein
LREIGVHERELRTDGCFGGENHGTLIGLVHSRLKRRLSTAWTARSLPPVHLLESHR